MRFNGRDHGSPHDTWYDTRYDGPDQEQLECPTCDGYGKSIHFEGGALVEETCQRCKGFGWLFEDELEEANG